MALNARTFIDLGGGRSIQLSYKGISMRRFAALMAYWAREYGVVLVGGTIPERDGDRLYNTCFVFDKSGNVIATHRKAHMFDIDIPGGITFKESDSFAPGDDICVFDTEYGRMLRAAQTGFINATDLADYLVKKGLPFRSAYKFSGQIVAECIEKGLVLETLPLAEYKKYSPLFENDLYDEISLKACVEKRSSAGGTSVKSVEEQIKFVKEYLK